MKQRFRLQFKFWLDVNKPDEHVLAEAIEELKQNGVFSRAIRDGLRLVIDLWRGNLDMLLSLFPWVEDALYERFLAARPGPDAAIQEQLRKLERLLIEQGNTPIQAVASPVAAAGGPKPLTVPAILGPAPDDGDDVELVVRKAASDGRSAQNFLDSAFNLIG
jgi:hypothetical protein